MESKNRLLLSLTLLASLCALSLSCGRTSSPRTASDADIIFWHTLRDEYARAFAAIVDDFNASSPAGKVQLQFAGSYDDVFRKCSLAIKGGGLPVLATAYESMVTEYLAHDALVDIDQYMNHPEVGLSPESRDDIFPSILETNRYPEFGNGLYSFPFTKSVLMVYFNRNILKSVGRDAFPETWEDLLDVSRRIRDERGLPAYALSVDASTFDAMVLSCGGPIISDDQSRTFFDSPHAARALQILRTMSDERLLKITAYNSYDDRIDFVNQRVAYHIRSSAHRPFVAELVADEFQWDMAPLPHAADAPPRTVLFGGNVCMFKSTPEKERTAWEFLKYFTSAKTTARWAVVTGYVPVRAGAADDPALAQFFAADPRNRRAFEALPLARSEPRAPGWQSVRRIIEETVTDVVEGKRDPAQAARDLNLAAQHKLAEMRARQRRD